MQKHFINLTNGIEWIPYLTDYSFVRIESTAIEKDDWLRILRDLDVNLLMHLSLGYECHIYDCGTRREVSKTISVGVPYIKKFLTDRWLNCIEMRAIDRETQHLKRKIQYFKRYLNTNEIRLIGHSKSTINDGDRSYFKNTILESQINECSSRSDI